MARVRICRLFLLATALLGWSPAAHAAVPFTSAAATPGNVRIVVAHDAAATEAFKPKTTVIDSLVERGLLHLTRRTNANSAWLSLVGTNDRMGIKVYSAPGADSGTRVPVVAAVVRGLLGAGVPATNITIWDRRMADLRAAGYDMLAEKLGVGLASSVDRGFDEKVAYENPVLGNLLFGDLGFGRKDTTVSRRSHITKLLTTDFTRVISIAPLLNHNEAGTTGHLTSLGLGGADNVLRFEGGAERLATALPELFGQPQIADKCVLHITDALLCQYQGEQRSLLHYSVPMNQLWFGKDPVALDSLALLELERQRDIAGVPQPRPARELYANAELLELGVANLKRILTENAP